MLSIYSRDDGPTRKRPGDGTIALVVAVGQDAEFSHYGLLSFVSLVTQPPITCGSPRVKRDRTWPVRPDRVGRSARYNDVSRYVPAAVVSSPPNPMTPDSAGSGLLAGPIMMPTGQPGHRRQIQRRASHE